MDTSTLFTASGRISRKPFWILLLIYMVGAAIFGFVGHQMNMDWLVGIWFVIMVIPLLFNEIKRCHDRDRSGWFILVSLIPLVGPIWLIVELGFLPGTPGPNRFGPNPLGVTALPGYAA